MRHYEDMHSDMNQAIEYAKDMVRKGSREGGHEFFAMAIEQLQTWMEEMEDDRRYAHVVRSIELFYNAEEALEKALRKV